MFVPSCSVSSRSPVKQIAPVAPKAITSAGQSPLASSMSTQSSSARWRMCWRLGRRRTCHWRIRARSYAKAPAVGADLAAHSIHECIACLTFWEAVAVAVLELVDVACTGRLQCGLRCGLRCGIQTCHEEPRLVLETLHTRTSRTVDEVFAERRVYVVWPVLCPQPDPNWAVRVAVVMRLARLVRQINAVANPRPVVVVALRIEAQPLRVAFSSAVSIPKVFVPGRAAWRQKRSVQSVLSIVIAVEARVTMPALSCTGNPWCARSSCRASCSTP